MPFKNELEPTADELYCFLSLSNLKGSEILAMLLEVKARVESLKKVEIKR